jgi:mannitol/fructose-specific phosphotransferase system IIA component
MKDYEIRINVTAENREAAIEAAYEFLRDGGEPDEVIEAEE